MTNVTILLCFLFLFLVVSNSFFSQFLVEIQYARLKLALATPKSAPIIVANDAIEMLPVVTDKKINDLST